MPRAKKRTASAGNTRRTRRRQNASPPPSPSPAEDMHLDEDMAQSPSPPPAASPPPPPAASPPPPPAASPSPPPAAPSPPPAASPALAPAQAEAEAASPVLSISHNEVTGEVWKFIQRHVEEYDPRLTAALSPEDTDKFFHKQTLSVLTMLGLYDTSTGEWKLACEDIASAVERISTKSMEFESQSLTDDSGDFFCNQDEFFTGILTILAKLVSPDQSKATPSSTGASAPAASLMSAADVTDDKAELLKQKAEIERKLAAASPQMTPTQIEKIQLKERIEEARRLKKKETEAKKAQKKEKEEQRKEAIAQARKVREEAAKKAREEAAKKKAEAKAAKEAAEAKRALQRAKREEAKAAKEAAVAAMSEEDKRALQRAKREEAKAAKAAKEAAEAAETARLAKMEQLSKTEKIANRQRRKLNGEEFDDESGDEVLTDEEFPLVLGPPPAAAFVAEPENRCSTTLSFVHLGLPRYVQCTGEAKMSYPSSGSQPRVCLDREPKLLDFLTRIGFPKRPTCCACHSTVASLLKEIKAGSKTVEEAVLAWEGFCVIHAGYFKPSDPDLSLKVWRFSKIAAEHLPNASTPIKSVFSKGELASAGATIKQNGASKQEAKDLQAQLDAINQKLARSSTEAEAEA